MPRKRHALAPPALVLYVETRACSLSLIRNYWQTASKESVLLSQQLVDTNAHITVSAVQPVTFRGPHECGTYPSLKLRAEECWRGASRERSAQAMAEAGSVPPPRARFRTTLPPYSETFEERRQQKQSNSGFSRSNRASADASGRRLQHTRSNSSRSNCRSAWKKLVERGYRIAASADTFEFHPMQSRFSRCNRPAAEAKAVELQQEQLKIDLNRSSSSEAIE